MPDVPVPTAIDTFAGAGGLSLGITWAGFDIRCAFDNNKYAAATYRRNFTHPFLEKSVENISGEELLRLSNLKKGELVLLAGGPPCQGFSVQRRGEDNDPRNMLVLEYGRLIAELRPVFFLMENVVGLKNRRGKTFLAKLISIAESLGYECQTKVLDAVGYGVPQFRKRLFVVGELPLDGGLYFQFPKPTHQPEEYRTVRDAIADLPPPPEDFTDHPDWPNHRRERLSEINRLRISYVPQGGGREHIPPELQLDCHKISVEKAGHRYVYGRLAWDKPAGTITARFDSFTRGRFAHPEEDRTITLREGARLQTFPDWFVFEGPKVEVAKQIGNAVPPLLAKILGLALREAYSKRLQGDPPTRFLSKQTTFSFPTGTKMQMRFSQGD